MASETKKFPLYDAPDVLEAEDSVRILLDSTPLGAMLWDAEDNLLYCNQTLLSMFGIVSQTELAQRFHELSPVFQPDGSASKEKTLALLHAAFESGYHKCEWMHRTASGDPLPTKKNLIRIPWQGSWCIAVYTRDMRERIARREAEERARMLLDTIPEAAVLFNQDDHILDCNHTFLRMFGLADHAEYKICFHELSPAFQPDGAASRSKARAFARAAFESGRQKFAWMHCTRSGEALPTEITLVRLPWQGGWCLAAYIRDLRAIKAQELQARQAEERAQSLEVISRAAQMASEAKSEFLAKMSHELRTPLNVVIGFLGLELQKKLPRETADNLEISLDACHNLLHLINDILDISKIEAGRFELANINYRLVGLIDELVRLDVFRLESKPISFCLEVDENLPSWFYGDDLRIKQVINNLLSNAFKYTEHGTVTLSVGLAPEEEMQAGSAFLRFSVRDTGQGIEAGNLENLFTSYARFDSKTNRLIEGTGLGLPIAKGLLEQMGGRMEVASEYGKGSVFSCVIPQLVIDPTPIGSLAMQELTGSRATLRRGKTRRRAPWQCAHMPYARVLVVDDVPANLGVARAMLQRYGMAVDCVAGGREAIELIRSGQIRYNAVFMDHMMPGMDGVEALRWIRGINSDYARAVPIIILTANVVAGNEQKFLDLGFQAFLGKPVDPSKLDAVLNRWVKDARQEAGLNAENRVFSAAKASAAQDARLSGIRIEGLDAEEAVSRFGCEESYLEVLRAYAVHTPQLLEQMRRLGEADLAEYALVAHGMKGASYGVGARTLGDMAKKLERAATSKNGRKVRQGLSPFLNAAEKLLRDVGALLLALGPEAVAEEDKPLKAAPDPGALAVLYRASLSCSHSTMVEQLRVLEQYRYQADGELVGWLRARVDALEYDQINERLAEYGDSV
ncbi:MAG: response regulator [Deltaproteobacteria bacterium]|jgi:signal transduction histidine kinase/CheY-like chemotaxis protein/HPt (histidine-containing phosphotransfer) domain-containing protein|nr:response regulator [Deltaproteobacteria bacterium]